jgi:uncharacterized membrane protein SpoIIM required for sporulation
MIIDLEGFIDEQKGVWRRLEERLDRIDREPDARMSLEELQTFHTLYQRTAADLAKINTFASAGELRRYLEMLVSRAYAEIHSERGPATRLRPLRWFFGTFPRAFRRHVRAFWLAVAATAVGALFGAGALAFDPDAKEIILPFDHLLGDPSERVAEEEQSDYEMLEGTKTTGSAFYMTHNTQVSITAMALGMTWGIGTIVMLFYNGVILGAVFLDYILAGEAMFVFGWLLPHGAVEIPAILLAGQAGFVLAAALIGRGSRVALGGRLRAIGPDLVTLICGVALFLVWAGIVEAFLSQYHEPVLPYPVKIAFGAVELAGVILFLSLAGRRGEIKTPEAGRE